MNSSPWFHPFLIGLANIGPVLHAEVHKDFKRIFGSDPAIVGVYGWSRYPKKKVLPHHFPKQPYI